MAAQRRRTSARLTVDAELRVVDATPECSALLGIPRESLVGDSLADVFLRGVRRAYVEYAATLSFHVTRSVRNDRGHHDHDRRW